MQRETIKIQAGEHIVELKSYLTAGEVYTLKEALQREIKINSDKIGDDGKPEVTTPILTAEFFQQQEKKLMSILIFSIDGQTEKASEVIFNLKDSDYQIVLAVAKNIEKENLTPAK